MMLAAALALLLQAEEKPDPVRDGLCFLISHQRDDGSWGAPPKACTCRHTPTREPGDLESTAWAILALGGAGYTELSKDEIRGRHVGIAVRSALDWMIAKQDKEGAFDRDHPSVNAISALAVIETYGMTVRRKEAAERAYAWVEKQEIADVVGRIRQGMVLQSGKLSEIGQGHDERVLALAALLDKEKGELAKWGSLLLRGFVLYKRMEKPPVDFDQGDPINVPLEALHVFACASFLLSGGDRWHEWFKGVKDALAPRQRAGDKVCEAGSWEAETFRDRVRSTAIRCLTLEHYRCYYCRSAIFRKK